MVLYKLFPDFQQQLWGRSDYLLHIALQFKFSLMSSPIHFDIFWNNFFHFINILIYSPHPANYITLSRWQIKWNHTFKQRPRFQETRLVLALFLYPYPRFPSTPMKDLNPVYSFDLVTWSSLNFSGNFSACTISSQFLTNKSSNSREYAYFSIFVLPNIE